MFIDWETFKKLYHISVLARIIAFGLTISIAVFIVHKKSKGKYILQSTLSFLQLTYPLGEKTLSKMIQLLSFFFKPFMTCSTYKYSPYDEQWNQYILELILFWLKYLFNIWIDSNLPIKPVLIFLLNIDRKIIRNKNIGYNKILYTPKYNVFIL